MAKTLKSSLNLEKNFRVFRKKIFEKNLRVLCPEKTEKYQ